MTSPTDYRAAKSSRTEYSAEA